MTHDPLTRLRDILAACGAITDDMQRPEPDGDMLYDEIRCAIRLLSDISDTSQTVVWVTARDDIPKLAAAIRRIVTSFGKHARTFT